MGGPLWDFDMKQFRDLFVIAADQLDLQKWRPVLYMGLHTGASLSRLEDTLTLQEDRSTVDGAARAQPGGTRSAR